MFVNRSRRQIGRSGWVFAAVACFLALATHAVLGQTGSQAEIIGIVTDESGAVSQEYGDRSQLPASGTLGGN
jgi:hypothetical protein